MHLVATNVVSSCKSYIARDPKRVRFGSWALGVLGTVTRPASPVVYQMSVRSVEWHHTPYSICSTVKAIGCNLQCGTTWLWSQTSSTWTTDDRRRVAGLSQQQQQQQQQQPKTWIPTYATELSWIIRDKTNLLL